MSREASKFYYLADYKSAAEANVSLASAPYVLGAMCFRGEHEKARGIFRSYENKFSISYLIFARFHLGISYTRTSEYKHAESLFVLNWKSRHHPSLGAREKFLIYQGLSFYKFFFSQHESSLAFAKRANSFCRQIKTQAALFGALVNELIAHNYYQLGRPVKGEGFLKKAIELTRDSNLKVLEQQFEASFLIYSSQFELDIFRNIEKLKKLLSQTPDENDYTCSELVLQIAKLLLLGGRYKESNDYLIQNFNFIFKNDNKRKVSKLNTLLAQLMIPRGQHIEALSLLRVAKQNLDEIVDISLLAPVLGLEIKILKFLGQNFEEQEKKLKLISSKSDKSIINQINSRNPNSQASINTEDPLGVVFHRAVHRDVNSLNDIIENGLYYLVGHYFDNITSKRVIFVHPKNEGVFFMDEDEIIFSKKSFSKNQAKLLSLLNERKISKSEIIQSVWGYENYDPIRHDHLVYTLVRRLRGIFGTKRDWIRSTGEDEYYIDQDTQFIQLAGRRESSTVRHVNQEVTLTEEMTAFEDLNFRQIQIVEGIFEMDFSAGDAAAFFNVNRMTAYRDLNELVEKGFLIKRGRNRGTRYAVS